MTNSVIDMPNVKGLEFHYDPSPQRSPQWLAVKRGRIGASRLGDWLSTSKQKNSLGKPLKARLDYEKELMFERQFNTNFEKWTSSAMDEGVELEAWAADQYAQIKGVVLEEVGCWYNEFFAASPDRKIQDVKGGIEIKLLKDNKFTATLIDGPEDKYRKQMQGQMWATGWEFIDFVAVNTHTGKIVIIRVERDEDEIAYLAEAVQEQLVAEEFKTENVYDVIGEIPVGLVFANEENDNSSTGGW